MNCKTEIYDIRKYENLALKYQQYGFHVSFSGGKDSIVLLDLMKKSKVRFKAFFYLTGLDHPSVPIFIRKNYPDVCIVLPMRSFSSVAIKKGFLPSRSCRYCCEFLKECHGQNSVVVDGVRSGESFKRSLRNDFEFSCCGGRDKFIKHLLFTWSEEKIWDYIKEYKLQVPSVYNEFSRCGCIGCPMQSSDTAWKEFEKYPKYKKYYISIIEKMIASGSFKSSSSSAEEYFTNWVNSFSHMTICNSRSNYELIF